MFDGRDPIYLQIADQIRSDVVAGRLHERDQVMSTTQYAQTYRINPATAAKAFTELVDEGVLYKQRGVGMFVADGARERLRADRRDAFYSERLAPVLEEARYLGISRAELIQYLDRTTSTTETSEGGAQ
ncbi:GntR family transcriptional regulator [Ruania halotolerans]|uniref:GntR family transcriptional regulator n=1 Tax=Ruania halotolerans TaxID=2897773 RepID=UPI001E43E715|nr:GntR family transcriptional regulator [Ruania halotolerans]UFU05215.1 GntR family transcriptional regulator [Ruania halotolerans]